MEAVDTTAKDVMAAAATDTTAVGMMAADSPGVAVTTTMWRRCRPQIIQPAVRGTGARSATVRRDEGRRAASSLGRHRAGRDGRGGFHLQILADRSFG